MEKKNTSLLIMAGDSPESYSPAGERVRHLALAAGSRFDKVTVLTLREGQSKYERQRSESRISLYGINFTRAVPFPLSALFDPVKFLMFVAHGWKLSRSIRLSFIMGSMPPLEVGISALLLSRLFHARLIIDLRDDWESAMGTQLARYIPKPLIKAVALAAKQVYSYSSLILSVTQTIASTIRNRGIRTNIVFVPNGADTTLFKPQDIDVRNKVRLQNNLPLNKMIVVYSGSGLNAYYRLDLVLSSVRLLPKSAAEKLYLIFFVYDGQRYLEKLKRQFKIPDDKVEIRSPIPRNQLAAVLSACDIGLVPFDSQSYLLCARSTKIYEYLGCGLFVVSTGPRGGELDHFFSANPNLGFFTLPTAHNFVSVLLQVIEKAEDLLRDDRRGFRYRFVKKNFDRQTIMTKTAHVLLSVATASRQRVRQ